MKLSSRAALVVITIFGFAVSSELKTSEMLPSRPVTVISNVTVIDGLGGAPIENQYVLLQDGLIGKISNDPIEIDPEANVIDGSNMYLLPGLWDMHAHTFADETAMDLYLAAGVTGLRDMGCSVDCTRELGRLRQAYLKGSSKYPRIVVAGPMLDGDSPYDEYPSHLQITLRTLPEVLSLLQVLQVDLIKTRDFLSRDEFMALVGASAAMNLPIAGHVPTSISVNDAIAVGLDTVEHEGSLFGGLLLACSTNEASLRGELLEFMREATASGNIELLYSQALSADFLNRLLDSYDEQKADGLVEAFLESGAASVPTLIIENPTLRSSDPLFRGRRKADDEDFRNAPESLLSIWRQTAGTEVLGQPFSDQDLAAMERQYEYLTRLLGKMYRAGVPILAGTDAAFPDGTPWIWPGYSLHDELELLVDIGMSPTEAIAAATGRAAQQMGLDDVGVIAEGKRADLLLLSRNPAEDIHNTRAIDSVWVNGIRLDREALFEQAISRSADHKSYWD